MLSAKALLHSMQVGKAYLPRQALCELSPTFPPILPSHLAGSLSYRAHCRHYRHLLVGEISLCLVLFYPRSPRPQDPLFQDPVHTGSSKCIRAVVLEGHAFLKGVLPISICHIGTETCLTFSPMGEGYILAGAEF